MSRILSRARRALSMDANEAIDPLIGRYLRLFRRHLVLMHVLHVSGTIALYGVLWVVAGARYALAMLALWLGGTVLVTVIAWVKRHRSAR